MSTEVLYLKEEAYFEPLINHWFAWSYLMPPVQASRYITSTHKRIMSSFVKNSQLHIMATKESALAGGDFLNARADQINDIKGFLREIDEKRTDLIELSDAVKALDEIIRGHTSGESIEYIYEKVPTPLKGYVEITLDINHNASYRLLETLLYHSKYYQKSLQTVSFGLISKVEERPFCFSTPRIADDNHLQLDMDFCHPDLEVLLKSRTLGAPKAAIDEIFSRHQGIGGLD